MDILEIKNITYRYTNSSEKILSSINQKFQLGKFYAIIGKSGAGKSTLLSLLAGLDKPQTGKVLFKNKNIEEKGYSLVRDMDMVGILVKIFGCNVVNIFILIAVHGIQNNSIFLCLTDILIAKSNHGGGCIPICGNAFILKNTALQLIFKAVGIVKFASRKALGKA